MLNGSEIRDGVNQSFYSCAILKDGEDPTTVPINNNSGSDTNQTEVDISDSYTWETRNYYGYTVAYMETDGQFMISSLDQE